MMSVPDWWMSRGPQRVTWSSSTAESLWADAAEKPLYTPYVMPDGEIVRVGRDRGQRDLDRALALYCAPCYGSA